mmetsp:Transcript_18629/g.20881  ORF Transcript_18629/g.20881 Transcript_18629/m.20881 type:complete len:1054 (+) Transcript_18629:514-3675(+)|eukprot:CAMPEP_0170778156 /NCGR_PEP_ID=MMETSP0733-20121128/12224_1 /TAXON_ID=186038 /ORGANISM="Fragilariopsis kerguelensis, Strain L26-C5" /LENGTH=1053 /DNA_ID=CAMNT_0011121527 /DNA_START=231 /DNA_END=3392 /DNA_ORIENTATION=+
MNLSKLLLMTALSLNQSVFAYFEAKESSIGSAADPSDHGEISTGFTIGITSDPEENTHERLLMPATEGRAGKASKSSKKAGKKGKKKSKKTTLTPTPNKCKTENMMKCTSPCSDNYLTCENEVEVEKTMPAGQRCYENKAVLTSEGHCVLANASSFVMSFDVLDACTNYPLLEACANDVESGAPYNGQIYYDNDAEKNGTWYWKDNVIVSYDLGTDDDTGEAEWDISYRIRFAHDQENNRTFTYTAKTDYGTTRVKNWTQFQMVDGEDGYYKCQFIVRPPPVTLFLIDVVLDNPALLVIVDGEAQFQSINRSEYTTETTVLAAELGEEYVKEKGKNPDEEVRVLTKDSGITDRDGNTVSAIRPEFMYINEQFLEDDDSNYSEIDEALYSEIQIVLQYQLGENLICEDDLVQEWNGTIDYGLNEDGKLNGVVTVTPNNPNNIDLDVEIQDRRYLARPKLAIQSVGPLIKGPSLSSYCANTDLDLPLCQADFIELPNDPYDPDDNRIRRSRRNLERLLEFDDDENWIKKEFEDFFPESGDDDDELECEDDENIRFTIRDRSGRNRSYKCEDIENQRPSVRYDNCGEQIVGSRILVGNYCRDTCRTCEIVQSRDPLALFDSFSSGLDPATKQELLDKFLGSGPGLPEARKLLDTFQRIDTLLRRIYGFVDGNEDGIISVYELLQALEDIRPEVEELKETVDALSFAARAVSAISQIKPFMIPIRNALQRVSRTLRSAIDRIKRIEKRTIEPTKPRVKRALEVAEDIKGAVARTAYVNQQLFVIPINTTRNCESVETMAELVNDATAGTTDKIFDVAADIEEVFEVVEEIRVGIQGPIDFATAMIRGVLDGNDNLNFLSPIVRPFTDALNTRVSVTIPFFWCTTTKRVTIPYPCGVRRCCRRISWIGNVCVPCGVNWCSTTNTITIPKWCDRRFSFTVRDVIEGIQGIADIVMAPLNFAMNLVIEGTIALVRAATGVDLNNIPLLDFVDISSLALGKLLPDRALDDIYDALPSPFDEFSEVVSQVLGADEYDANFVIDVLNQFDLFENFSPICESTR